MPFIGAQYTQGFNKLSESQTGSLVKISDHAHHASHAYSTTFYADSNITSDIAHYSGSTSATRKGRSIFSANMGRRIGIKTNNISELVGKAGVTRAFEGA